MGCDPIDGTYVDNGSPIDSFYIDPETKKKVWPNYRQRAWFFTQGLRDEIGAMLTEGLGDAFGGFETSDFYNTKADHLGREYLYAVINEQRYTVAGLWSMIYGGFDLQGRSVWDFNKYKIGPGYKGKFSLDANGALQYTPETR